MAHILIADDVEAVREDIRRMVTAMGHTCEEASDMIEVLRAKDASEAAQAPFDLVLLDYEFAGGASGLDILKRLGEAYCDHRVIMLTGHANHATAAASLGAINYLMKPVSDRQLEVALETALVNRERFMERRDELEAALELIDELAALAASNQELEQQMTQLQYWNGELKAALLRGGTAGQALVPLYDRTEEEALSALRRAPIRFELAHAPLRQFKVTKRFLQDLQAIYEADRLRFFSLVRYLRRLAANSLARGRQIEGVTGLFEYRVGAAERLYFRWVNDAPNRVLEAFGHKNAQLDIIEHLKQKGEDAGFVWERAELAPS